MTAEHDISPIFFDSFNPKDVSLLNQRMSLVAVKHDLLKVELGSLGEDSLNLYRPRQEAATKLLVAGGFHGEEPAGCWGILNFLELTAPTALKGVSVSWLPVVNPTGIRRGVRYNAWGENPNNGFCHTDENGETMSREGTMLVRSLDLVRSIAKDGFLSLHEDVDMTQFYLYTFEDSDQPGEFTEALATTEKRFFTPCSNGVVEGSRVKDGVIFRECDGSFEDRLFHEGIPRTACTETPGKLDIALRVQANAAIIEAFVEFHRSLK